MLNFNFSEKGLRLVSPPNSMYNFSIKISLCYILFTDQTSLSDCVYFLRYRVICTLQLFANQAVTS